MSAEWRTDVDNIWKDGRAVLLRLSHSVKNTPGVELPNTIVLARYSTYDYCFRDSSTGRMLNPQEYRIVVDMLEFIKIIGWMEVPLA